MGTRGAAFNKEALPTEPTLADNQQNGSSKTGAVYVPAVCVVADSGYAGYANCGAISSPLSGVLVFTSCH